MAANARHDLANIVRPAGYARWLIAVAVALMLVACGDAEDAPPPAHAARFGLNDVSILLPMPSTAADGNLLRFGDHGVGGPLLPQAWFDDIAVFATEPHVAPAYASWAIVGIRLDPCFPTLALLASDPSQCRRQVRLIAQPIVEEFGAAGTIDPAVAIDSAVHLLFDLGASEFEQFLTAWMAQVAAAPSDVAAPLQVHPVIASEGLGGPFAVDLRRLILATVGEGRLSQVTFIEGRTFDWEFGGLRIIDGVPTPLVIADLAEPGAATQRFIQEAAAGFAIAPTSSASEGLMALAGDVVGDSVVLTASRSEVEAALQLALNVDNPSTGFHADSLDCVTCHVAGRAVRRAEQLGYSAAALTRFTHATFDLTQTTNTDLARDPTMLRAFGYNARSPVVNDRVINESAAVADALYNR